jgi:hypothetical protein
MGIMIPMMPSYPSPGWGSLIPKMSIWFLEAGIKESRSPFSKTIIFAEKIENLQISRHFSIQQESTGINVLEWKSDKTILVKYNYLIN